MLQLQKKRVCQSEAFQSFGRKFPLSFIRELIKRGRPRNFNRERGTTLKDLDALTTERSLPVSRPVRRTVTRTNPPVGEPKKHR